MSSCVLFDVKSGAVGGGLAHTLSVQGEPVRIVHEAIEDSVGIGRIADHVVPLVDRDLAGDDGGASAVAFFENLEEIVACGGVERFETPVVESR